MRRLLVATLLVTPLVACDGTPFFDSTPTEPDAVEAARVEVVGAVRGRVEPTRWSITMDLKNEGGPGEFYLHLQAVSTEPGGPRTECGLTPERRVPGGWRESVGWVIECPRAPQWVTVYTRSDGETEYRQTDSWVY